MREELIKQDLIGKNFAELWPMDVRPVRLAIHPGVTIKFCTLSSESGPDRATFLNAKRERCRMVAPHISEGPTYILLE